MNVMILAAGEGTRFRPHTLVKPKPAIPFLNVPLAFYSLSLLGNLRPSRCVVNTFHLPNQVVDLFKSQLLPTKNLFFSHEEGEIQGSGGGIKKAQSLFDPQESIIVMNGDEVILPRDPEILQKALDYHQSNDNLATLVVIEHPEVGSKFGGIWVDDKNNILEIGKEKPSKAQMGYHFVGVGIYSPRIFQHLPEGPSHIFKEALLPALKKGEKVDVFPIKAHWFETGNLKDYLQATEECLNLLKKEAPESEFLRKTMQTFSPLSQYIAEKNILTATELPKGLTVKGFAVIGSQVQWNKIKSLERSVIEAQVQIQNENVANELLLKT